jgi:hypothetical protein
MLQIPGATRHSISVLLPGQDLESCNRSEESAGVVARAVAGAVAGAVVAGAGVAMLADSVPADAALKLELELELALERELRYK